MIRVMVMANDPLLVDVIASILVVDGDAPGCAPIDL